MSQVNKLLGRQVLMTGWVSDIRRAIGDANGAQINPTAQALDWQVAEPWRNHRMAPLCRRKSAASSTRTSPAG